MSASSAASGSHKRVQVCIRVRPPQSKDDTHTFDSVAVNGREKTISVVTNPANGSGTCFHFDQVLDRDTDQAGVYRAAAAEIVDSVLSGYNGTIMAYGQTGAGKTYTMSGGKRHFDDRGICARAISSIFQKIQRDADHSFVVRVSYVEVYNENLYDLLTFNENHHSYNNNATSNNREDLVIQENDKGQTFVRGLARPVVKAEEDAFDLLFQGETNRTIAEHCLNASSTRSHCIFTVYVERQANPDAGSDIGDPSSSVAVFSKLHLVDLAGSERMKKTHVSGVMLKEASHINKSLTFLEQVVIALGDKKRSHIPYRQTPLTNLLKDSLGGNCRTMLVACVWPEDSHNDQTLATLKFATRMMRVKTSAIVNVAGGGGGVGGSGAGSKENQALLQKYVGEIKRLQDELAMHDTLSGRSCVDYDLKTITSASARAQCCEQLQLFIRDESKPPPIQNLAQVEQLFKAFRELFLDESRRVSDKELFDMFKLKNDPKPESLLDLDVAKQNLRTAKAQMSTLGLEVNKIKLNIDDYTAKLQGARSSTPNNSVDIGDSGERQVAVDLSTEFLVLQLRDAKKHYREVFEQFQEKKAEVKYLLKIKEQMLQRVTREFEAWKADAVTRAATPTNE